MPNSRKTIGHVSQSGVTENTPYVGPRPFTSADQDIFFGRNQEAIELTSLIKAHPEVLLYAPSGAGKTSLLFAQVIPILDKEEEFDVLPTARVRSQESSPIPEDKIANIYMFNALKDLSDDKLSVIERTQLTLAEYLKQLPRPPVHSAQGSKGGPIDENTELRLPRVIIFDQFEEIFTLYPERYKDRQDFFAQVAAALEADSFLRVIFSMREDYIAEVDPFVDILPENLHTRFRLERLRKANALSAVKQPLETDRVKGRRQFSPGAAELLVDRLMLIKVKTASGEKIEVPGEFVDPVQLQVVCQTLWEKLPPDDYVISADDLDKYANVDEALSNFYENSVRRAVAAANKANQASPVQAAKPSQVSAITEGAVRGWFEQKLITREGKRNMVFREGDMTAGMSNLVVDALDNQHVIRVEIRGGEPWYELSHDRFIPPIRESNRRFLLQQPLAKRKAQELEARADEWLKSQRNDSLLLNRAELLEAQDWMRSETAAIGYSDTLLLLIRASEAAIEHEDNKQLQMLAEAQRLRVVAEQKRSRQMKIGFVVASILLVCALGSTIYAYRAQGKAHVEKRKAEDVAGKLKIARADEEAQRLKAEKQKSIAENQSREADKQREDAVAARGLAEKSEKATKKAKALLQGALADTEKARTSLAQQNTVLTQTTIDLTRTTIELAEISKERERRNWSLKLAWDADSQLADNPELALRLALESANYSQTNQGNLILGKAYLNFKGRGILKGHSKTVWQAAYSPDGQFIFTASEDGTVKMWDAKTNLELKTFKGEEDGVHAIAMSANGTKILTEATEKGRLWNVSDGTSIVLDGLTGPVAAIAFSPNGKLVATEATSDKLLVQDTEDNEDEEKAGATPRIWDADNGAIKQTLIGHEGSISALSFSPKSDLLATASWDNTARIWDVATGRELKVLRGHTAPLTSVGFDRTGQFVVTGSYDGTARVWEVATGKETIVLRGHAGGVRLATFSTNGAFIFTVGQRVTAYSANDHKIPLPPDMPTDDEAPLDNTVRVWDARTGRPLVIIIEPTSEISLANFSTNGKMIATATKDGTVRVWEAATGQVITKLLSRGGNMNSIAFSPDGKFVLTANEEQTAQVWEVANSTSLAQPIGAGTPGSRQYVQFDATGENIINASTDGSVRLVGLTGELKPGSLLKGISEAVFDIAISPNYKFAVTASKRARRVVKGEKKAAIDRDAHVWDLKSNKPIRDLKHPVSIEPATTGAPTPGKPAPEKKVTPKSAPIVKKVIFSPKGTYVLTAADDGTACVWETLNWTIVREVKTSEKRKTLGVWAFDSSERFLVTVESTGNISAWEISTGTNRPVIQSLDKEVNSLAFNEKDDLVVTASNDSTARVWTTEGKVLAVLRGHTGRVLSAEFSRDGRFIVTAGDDGTVMVWNVDTGSAVRSIKINEGVPVLSATFSPDGKSIAIVDARALLYVLDCEVCYPLDEFKRLANELKPRQLKSDEEQRFMIGKPPF